MSTITTLAAVDSGSTSRTTINTNFSNLNTDKIQTDSSDTLTNKTIDADGTGNSITNIENADIKAAAGIVMSKTAFVAGTGLTLSTDTLNGDTASTSAVGVVELATTAEIDTGTDTGRAIPVDQLVASKRNVRWLVFNMVLPGADVAADTNIVGDFVSPIAGTILQSDTTPFYLYATNSTAGVTGTMVVDISIGGTSIMTTNKLDFDTTEKTTTTAATPPDLTTTALAVGDIITLDVDSIHSGTAAKGLTVYMAIRE